MVLMLVEEIAAAGGIESGLVALGNALVARSHHVAVFSRAPASGGAENQYTRALRGIGAEIVAAPAMIARLTRLNWTQRDRMVVLVLRLLAPLTAILAVGVSALRRQSLSAGLRSVNGWLRGRLRALAHVAVDRLSYRTLDRHLQSGALPFPDVVHVHGYRCGEVPARGIEWARRRGLPVVYHEQGVSRSGDVEHRPARLAHVAVAISRSVEDGLRQACGCNGPLRRIPYIVEPRPIAPGDVLLPWLNLWSDRIVVGTIGRLHEQKGHSTLLNAAPVVIERFPDLHLVFAGDGPLRTELELQARRLGIEDRVTFMGTMTQSDLPALYERIDVVAMPSRWEALGIAAVEAMMYGKPVIASDLEGLAELVVDGATGFLVPPDDAGALASALARLAASPELRTELGQRGQERYRTLGFSADRVAEAFLEAYRLACERVRCG